MSAAGSQEPSPVAPNRLDVGGVIRRVFEIYFDQAPVLLPAAAVVFVFTGILTGVLVATAPGLALLAIVIYLLATTLFTGMVVELVADLQDGRRDASVGQLLQAVVPVIGQLILVAIVVVIGVFIGFILLIIPGLILITIWSLVAPVVVLERPGVFPALGRSRELVRGNGWQVFGVLFVLEVGIAIVSLAIELAADSAGSGVGIVARVVIGVLAGPIASLASAVLYFQLGGARSADALVGVDSAATDPFGADPSSLGPSAPA